MVPSIFRRFLLLALALTAISAGGCAPPTGSQPAHAPGAREVVDDLGRTVKIDGRPSRIVSLAPNLTEILFALGAGDRVAAVTSYCNYPPEATAKPKIGDTLKPDLERLIALKPDLVLVSTASQVQGLADRLSGLGIPTFVSNPRTLDGVISSIRTIGAVISEDQAADTLAASLDRRLQAVTAAVAGKPQPKVLFIVGDEPLITTGQGTFIDDLILRAGATSISHDEPTEWPQLSPESVIARAPDVFIIPLSTHGISDTNGGVPATLRETPAARNDRIVRIEADLVTRPGPRLVDGLEQLARALHPEAFR